jgi:type I restriction enzyme S subunit
MTYARTRLKFLLDRSDAGAWGDDALDGGVDVLRSTDIDLHGNVDGIGAARRRLSRRELVATSLERGDIVVVKSSGSDSHLGKAGWIDARNAGSSFSNFLQRLRVNKSADSRFIWYFLNCQDMKTQIRTLSSTTTGLQNLTATLLGEAGVPQPPLDQQRRIADFLDAETAKVDRGLQQLAELQKLTSERRGSLFSDHLRQKTGIELDVIAPKDSGCTRTLPLSRILRQLTNGYVGPTRDLLVSEGTKYIQSLHIKNGRINFERHPYYVPTEWALARPRIRLSVGDVLIVQTGAVGQVAIVDQEYAGSSCHALLIARPNWSVLSSPYLYHSLRSSWGQQALEREQTGALHPHLEAGKVREIRVPVPSIDAQNWIAGACAESEQHTFEIETAVTKQATLMTERRQALITAAVTAQFDVSTGRGVDLA